MGTPSAKAKPNVRFSDLSENIGRGAVGILGGNHSRDAARIVEPVRQSRASVKQTRFLRSLAQGDIG